MLSTLMVDQIHFKGLLIFTFSLLLSGCDILSSSDNSGSNWSQIGLDSQTVYEIKSTQNYLYAATETDLYRKSLNQENSSWNALGLNAHLKEDLIVKDFVLFSESHILAGVQDSDRLDTTIVPIYKTTNGGDSWKPFRNNFGGEEKLHTAFISIEKGSDNDSLYALASGVIAISTDKGYQWEPLNTTWDSTSWMPTFIHVSNKSSNIVWAGGMNVIMTSAFMISRNGGKSWNTYQPMENIELQMNDAIIHPNDSDVFLAGLSSIDTPALIKSNDGGSSWFSVKKDIGSILSLTRDSQDPRKVFASGARNSEKLFYLKSDNFGKDWQEHVYKEGPTGLHTHDLILVNTNGEKRLYFGTTQGVFGITL